MANIGISNSAEDDYRLEHFFSDRLLVEHFTRFVRQTLLGGIELCSFEPFGVVNWVRGFFFLIAALSFCVGVSLFIIALVDLAYAMIGITNAEHAYSRHEGG